MEGGGGGGWKVLVVEQQFCEQREIVDQGSECHLVWRKRWSLSSWEAVFLMPSWCLRGHFLLAAVTVVVVVRRSVYLCLPLISCKLSSKPGSEKQSREI